MVGTPSSAGQSSPSPPPHSATVGSRLLCTLWKRHRATQRVLRGRHQAVLKSFISRRLALQEAGRPAELLARPDSLFSALVGSGPAAERLRAIAANKEE